MVFFKVLLHCRWDLHSNVTLTDSPCFVYALSAYSLSQFTTTLPHHTRIVYRQEIRPDHKCTAAAGCSFKHIESLIAFHRSTSGVFCLRSALLSQLEQLSRHLFHQRNTDRLRCTLQVLSALCGFPVRNMLSERMHRRLFCIPNTAALNINTNQISVLYYYFWGLDPFCISWSFCTHELFI